jgi:glycosyltransferase involved in cell wall biosynthesis
MSIGVAIPCYYGHIHNLTNLLDSIENQTVKPNKVVVSCSSTESVFETKNYSFPLEIIITKDCKNAAQNRNIASNRLLDMDYITYIDADDLMHPQRIEILMKVFMMTNCDIILHNFIIGNGEFNKIENIDLKINELKQCYSGCIINKILDKKYHIHHSQSSIKKYIYDIVKYPEEKEYTRKEDSVFCHRVFSIPNIVNVYIANELSIYLQSFTPF